MTEAELTLAALEHSDPVAGADQTAARAAADGQVVASLALAEVPILAGFRHVSEREPGPWICCAPCSGAMVAAYTVGAPATLDTAHKIRSAAGQDHVRGMSPAQLALGMERAYDLHPRSVAHDRAAIAAELEDGATIVVPLWYGKLPTELRRWSPRFTGGHSGALAGTRAGAWGWWDPLAPRGWTGELVDPDAIMPALWAGGILATSRSADMAITLPKPLVTGYTITTDGPTTFYLDSLCQELLFESDASHTYPYLGMAGIGPADARALIVQTGRPYADKEVRPTVLYVPRSKISAGPVPIAAPGDGPATPAELEAARLAGAQAEYERWRTALGIPDKP